MPGMIIFDGSQGFPIRKPSILPYHSSFFCPATGCVWATVMRDGGQFFSVNPEPRGGSILWWTWHVTYGNEWMWEVDELPLELLNREIMVEIDRLRRETK